MDRRNDYPLPTAWRGVASPQYLRLARWLSLAEELGGLRRLGPGGPGSMEGVLTARGCQAGQMDMTVTMLSQEAAQDELRTFMATELSRHERLVLMLFYADGLGPEQIAEVLDLPVATAGELLERSLAAVQEHFG